MLRKTRRALGFESLEGKLLLSHGNVDTAKVAHVITVSHVSLTGVVNGLPVPDNSADPGQVTQFTVTGTLGNMGKIKGTFVLSDPFYYGERPNLSAAFLSVANKKGTVDVFIAPSTTTSYNFVVTGGTGEYAPATGSGVLKVRFSQKLYGLVQVVMRSAPH